MKSVCTTGKSVDHNKTTEREGGQIKNIGFIRDSETLYGSTVYFV